MRGIRFNRNLRPVGNIRQRHILMTAKYCILSLFQPINHTERLPVCFDKMFYASVIDE